MQQTSTETALFCSQCGRSLPQSELVHIAGNWVCGECKTAYLSRVVAGNTAAPTALDYAGVGIRFGARFLDGLVAIIPLVIFFALLMPSFLRSVGTGANPAAGTLAIEGVLILGVLIFSLFYEVLMLRYWGATLGKMACGLRVVRPDGSGLGWGVCFGRYFMYNIVISAIPVVNWILLLTTVIMASTDDQKRGLHDRVCDTRVIRKRGFA